MVLARLRQPGKVWGLYEALLPAIRALPEVEHVTPVLLTPFSGTGGWDGHFVVEGQSQAEAAANPYINMEVAGPDYFATFDTPIPHGRAFTDADREDAAKVVIVSEAVARSFWPDEDPLGKRIRSNTDAEREWFTVAGVAGETRYRALRAPAPSVYFPYRQFPGVSTMIAVRTHRDAAAVVTAIRNVVRELRPDVVIWKAEPMEQLVARHLARPRLSTLLLAGFGTVALLLAAIGIYGVIALAVRQRTRELGVRLALGAAPAQLRRLMLREALLTAAAGVGLGVAGAIAGSRFLRALLFEVSPFDPIVLVGACAVLLAAATAAAYGPARRATRVEPAIALRSE